MLKHRIGFLRICPPPAPSGSTGWTGTADEGEEGCTLCTALAPTVEVKDCTFTTGIGMVGGGGMEGFSGLDGSMTIESG